MSSGERALLSCSRGKLSHHHYPHLLAYFIATSKVLSKQILYHDRVLAFDSIPSACRN